MFFQGRKEGFSDGWVSSGFVPKEKGEQGGLGGMMRGRVVLELSSGEETSPGVGVVGTEDSEISFDFLVSLFGLPISLGVVCSG